MENTLTTDQAAARLGVTSVRVRAMIRAGRLPAEKFGRDYVIRADDLRLVANRKVGRPPKPVSTEKHAAGRKQASNSGSSKKDRKK